MREYIKKLIDNNEVITVTASVDPSLEIAEITDRVSKSHGGGKALLFTDTGTEFPVITNMMGSDSRICLALGVKSLEELNARIEEMFADLARPKQSLFDKLKMLPHLAQVASWMPRVRSGRGECQRVVMKTPDLSKLPILKCWTHDGGPFVTLPLVHTKDPATGARNVGMYRMQVFSPTQTGMHWHRHKTGARHYDDYKKAGVSRMPVAVCLGGDPLYTYCATAPVPDNIDEYLLAGFIRRRRVNLVKCLTIDMEVPEDCDFVIEGYVDTLEEKVTEGPFGDHTGFYSLEDKYPVFHVTSITHRRDAVYPATIVGVPPQEDAYIAKATEKIFLAPIRLVMQPEVEDLWMPQEGTAHNISVITIDKRYPAQAAKVASAMWGAGQMMFNKLAVILSKGDDLRSAIRNIKVPDDIVFSRGTLDILDHTSDVMGMGGKMCIDATVKLPEEGIRKNLQIETPAKWMHPEGVKAINDSFCGEWSALFITASGDCEDSVFQLLEANAVEGVKFVLVFDENVPLDDASMLVWLAAANCDAVRDTSVVGNTLVFDARVKRGGRAWPNVVTSDRETINKVDGRWLSLGLGDFVESPSLKYLSLLLSDSAEVEWK